MENNRNGNYSGYGDYIGFKVKFQGSLLTEFRMGLGFRERHVGSLLWSP